MIFKVSWIEDRFIDLGDPLMFPPPHHQVGIFIHSVKHVNPNPLQHGLAQHVVHTYLHQHCFFLGWNMSPLRWKVYFYAFMFPRWMHCDNFDLLTEAHTGRKLGIWLYKVGLFIIYLKNATITEAQTVKVMSALLHTDEQRKYWGSLQGPLQKQPKSIVYNRVSQ